MNTTAEFETEIARLEAVITRYDENITQTGDPTGILGIARESVKDNLKAVKVMRAEKVFDLRLRVYQAEKDVLDSMPQGGEDYEGHAWRKQCGKVNEAQEIMEFAARNLRRLKNGLPV